METKKINEMEEIRKIDRRKRITEEEKPLKYCEMSQEQLSQEIKEQEQFINTLNVSEYTLKDIEKLSQDITREQERIKEKYQEYKESIKQNKERIKESQKELKRKMGYKESQEEFKKNMEFKLKIIKEIKEKLNINKDYYKQK